MILCKNEYIQSALKEIINIGGGNAATSLSKLINRPVHMEVPQLEFMGYDEVFQTIEAEDTPVKVVVMQLLSGEGSFLFVTRPEHAQTLAEMMVQQDIEISEELTDSAVTELVNILVNSFLNATMKILDENMIASVPIVTFDMFGSVLTALYVEQQNYDDNIIIMRNEFWSLGHKIEGALYFVPAPGFIERIIEKL